MISTRDKALNLVKELNLKSVKGLGYLSDELRHAEIYLSKSEISVPKDFDKGMESSEDGKNVYARTMARPYSPVRFFSSALTLSEEQLTRLHIHEALHRALPEAIRENESVVSEITLAITAPNANKDAVEQTVAKYQSEDSTTSGSSRFALRKEEEKTFTKMMKRSQVKASMWAFNSQDDFDIGGYTALQKIEAEVYPFDSYLSFGAEGSYFLWTENAGMMGPLGFFVKGPIHSWNGMQLLGSISHTSLPHDMFPLFMREASKLQLALRRETEDFFVEGSFTETMGASRQLPFPVSVDREEEITQIFYNPIFALELNGGKRLDNILMSSRLTYLKSNGRSLRQKKNYYGFETDSQEFTILAFRPEISYLWKKSFSASLFATLMLDSTPGRSFSDLGDVTAWGYGSRFVGASAAYHF